LILTTEEDAKKRAMPASYGKTNFANKHETDKTIINEGAISSER